MKYKGINNSIPSVTGLRGQRGLEFLKNSEFDQIVYSDFMSGKAQLQKYQETGRSLSKRSKSNRASAVI